MEIINQSLQDFKLGYASSSEGRDFLYPVLNGIDEYATITPWVPQGALFAWLVDFTPSLVDGNLHYLFGESNTNPFGLRVEGTAGTGKLTVRYLDNTGTAQFAFTAAGSIEAGRRYQALVTFSPAEVSIHLNGQFQTSKPIPADVSRITGIDQLAAAVSQNQFAGFLHVQRFIAYTPLQGISAMAGDGMTRHAKVNIPIKAGDTITFWHQFVPDATYQAWIGTAEYAGPIASDQAALFVFNASVFDLELDGVAVTTGTVTLVSGKHYEVKATAKAPMTLVHIGANNTEGAAIAGVMGDIVIRDLETGQEWNYANRNDSGNVLENINPATAEGPDIWNDQPTNPTITDWVFENGIWKRTGTTQGEVQINNVLTEGEHWKVSAEIRGVPFRTATLQVGGPPITGNRLTMVAQDAVEWTYYEAVMPAENVATLNGVRLLSSAAGIEVRNVSARKVTHGIWYENGVAMTPSAADAARTDLPLINQEWIFTSPGEIFEAYSGQQATLFGIDASNWQ